MYNYMYMHVETHSEPAVWEVGHDKNHMVSVPYTRQQRNDIVSATACDKQRGKRTDTACHDS